MNEQSRLRLELVRRFIAPYAADPECRAIHIVGSAARGVADENSDIDTTVAWTRPRTQAEQEAIVAEAVASGGALHYGNADDFAVYHFVDGIKVDVGHGALEAIETDLRKVLEEPSTDLIPQLIASGFLQGVALHGEDWVEGWKARLRRYPPELGPMMVRHHLKFFPHWAIRTMGVDRRDTLWLQEVFVEAAQNIVGVLFGLNRSWHPGKLKGIAWWLERLELKPPRLQTRLERLVRGEPAEALEEYSSLARDLFDLVDRHMPEIDTSVKRNRFELVLRR